MRIPAGLSWSLSLLCVCGVAVAGEAEKVLDEVSVIATRAPVGVARGVLGASVSILAPDDLEARQTRVVSDVLRDVPGVAVSRSGAVGGPTQVRIRGAEGNHVLVLVDGVKASDPFYDEFDFATLIADDIARVEVLRGQQSSLYGSDAIAGVISYSTLSGREAQGLSARFEGGSFNSLDASARYGGVAGIMDYAVSGGWQRSDGYRVARVGDRDIGSESRVVSGKFNFEISDALRIRTMLRANRTEADVTDEDYDTGTAEFGAVDGVGHFTNKTFIGSVRAEHTAMDGHWLNEVSVQRVAARRDGVNAFGPTGDKGARTRVSGQSTLRFGDAAGLEHLLTLAIDHENAKSENTASSSPNQDINNLGLVVEYNLQANDRLGLGAAFRRDDNNRFDDATTWRLQGSYLFDSRTRLHAAAGSGVKNPSLTELFGFYMNEFVGNPDLKPEKSRGWEAGVDQELLGGDVLVGATYFRSKLENEIYTVYGGPPDYIAAPANSAALSTQRGVEVTVEGRVSEAWHVAAAWTHLDAKEGGTEEIRRPPSIGSLNIGWTSPTRTFGANLTVRYNGSMTDSNFYDVGPSPVPMDAYTLVNLAFDWRFSGSVQFYGRVENALDQDYEEIYTYRAPGRAVYAGVRLKL